MLCALCEHDQHRFDMETYLSNRPASHGDHFPCGWTSAFAADSTPIGHCQRLNAVDLALLSSRAAMGRGHAPWYVGAEAEPSFEQPGLCPVAEEEKVANCWQANRYAMIPAPQAAINTVVTSRSVREAARVHLANALQQWPPPAHVPPVTTLLVRHIDRGLSQEDVLQQFPRTAFYNYDLLYVVYDVKRNTGSGRMIINFENPMAASAFCRSWHGQVHLVLSALDQQTGARRQLEVEDAHVQGFRADVRHYQSRLSRDLGAAFAPVIYDEGRRCDFWSYTVDPLAASGLISL